MTDNALKTQAFKLKGRLYTFTVLQLFSANPQQFEQQLKQVSDAAPNLFDNTPVVVDCTSIKSDEIDLDALIQHMRVHGMYPVAIQTNNPLLAVLAQSRGMPVLHASSTHDKEITDNAVSVADLNPDAVAPVSNRLHTTPVRSGQQLVCKGGDLVITASVSTGAELLADGNIHVYGALRGRALAGISGDINARIFCQSLEAELVSIAGYYRLSEAIDVRSSPCQIYLQDGHIIIDSIC